LGADVILPQVGKAVEKRRVGLIVQGAPARENAKIFNSAGELIGTF
jgi:aminomethyltransferase